MSKFRYATLTYTCQCPSKGTVYVPRIGDVPESYECRSPICIAIRAKIERQISAQTQNQEMIRELQREIARLKAGNETSQEIFNQSLLKIASKYENVITDFSKTFVQMLGPFPVPVQKKKTVKTIQNILRPTKTIQKPRRTTPAKPVIFAIPKKMPPLPPNFMAGDTYVSGIATSFGEDGF